MYYGSINIVIYQHAKLLLCYCVFIKQKQWWESQLTTLVKILLLS